MDARGLTWRKALKSGENGGACVELVSLSDAITVRDSKDPDGPRLTVSYSNFRRFTETLKNL